MDEWIRYRLHGGAKPEKKEGPLIDLIYDIPYLDVCGILPPLHLLNERLLSGGGDGGMSPGASWEPFEVSQAEYDALCRQIEDTPLEELQQRGHAVHATLQRDPEIEHHRTHKAWMRAAVAKHRDAYLAATTTRLVD